MPNIVLRHLPALFLAVAALASGFDAVSATAGENMIGRQSQNEGLLVVPAPGKVTIDGDLSDWDWSGRIWVFADSAVRERFSVQAAAMWDKDFLYLGAKWKDPTPMFSLINPAFNPDEGWKEDAWQMRVLTDKPLWITAWYYTPERQPALHIARWKNPNSERDGTNDTLLVAKPSGTDLGQGISMAYRADADGKGFAQELKIPWSQLYSVLPEIKPGLTLRIGNEFLWGDPTGKTFPIHRYADNMQPGATSREFYWSAKNSWGDVKLVAKGDVPVRQYVADTAKIPGTIPVLAMLPEAAARFTIVLEDQAGKRIRSLAADCDPADYTLATKLKNGFRTVEVMWDGLDDLGKSVPPGQYKVRGLTHKGLGADYEMTFYNPGTPPWATVDGRGAWGSDHAAPIGVAAGGDWTLVTWPFVEGGNGIIGVDGGGQKRWGDRRGVTLAAADGQYAYGYVTAWFTKETLCRFGLKDGSMRPFVLDGKERTFDLPLTEVLGTADPGKMTGLAVHQDTLALAMSSGKVFLLDASSAKVKAEIPLPEPGALAYDAHGTLYGVAAGQLSRLEAGATAFKPLTLSGLGKAGSVSTDSQGHIVVADLGDDYQVKAFEPSGKLAYTVGTKGGRPVRGVYDEGGLSHLSSVAVDARDHIWTVESWNFPRRVAVWDQAGKLLHQYVGNTGYAGAGSYLHDQDPTLAYVGPMELKLDKAAHSWKLQRVLWVPQEEKGESFVVQTGSNALPQRFRRMVGGAMHEYLYIHDPDLGEGTGNVLFMERANGWQPVAAICMAGHISGKMNRSNGRVIEGPSGELAGLNAFDGVIWSDTNGDGKVQRSECAIVPTTQPGSADKSGRCLLPLDNGWGGRIGDDFSIYASGLTRYKPLRFTADGAPVYGLESQTSIGFEDHGDIVPVNGSHQLLDLSWKNYPRMGNLYSVDTATGAIQWTYPNPFPGVHGSHDATMPKAGQLIGPLKTCGVAHIDDTIGDVFLMRGNLGQDFLMTTDGLYVGAMFQDGRLPGESLPNTEAALRGVPMEGFSEGGEPFNGWFGKQDDGRVRLTTGMAREAAMILEVKGLDTIQRFAGGMVNLSQKQTVEASADVMRRAVSATEKHEYTVARAVPAPAGSDGLINWKPVGAVQVSSEGQPAKAAVRLAYDDTNLYANFEVQDASPWLNQGKDLARLFKSGDALDIQLSGRPGAAAGGEPGPGDRRIVISQLKGQPVAVLMVPLDTTAPPGAAKAYTSPVGTKKFDRVEVLGTARVTVKLLPSGYVVEAALPWSSLGLVPGTGTVVRGDLGLIASDTAGMLDAARIYWSNPHTNLVNDEPLEAWLYPATWGSFKFE